MLGEKMSAQGPLLTGNLVFTCLVGENMYEHPANIYVPFKKEWFITNPVHRTADILDTSTVRYLKEGITPPDESMMAHLLNQGYLTEKYVSLPELYSTVPPENESEISFIVGLTYACNLQCVYCFQRPDLTTRNHAALTAEKIEALSRAVAALKRRFLVLSPDHLTWDLTGGEPLLPGNRPIVEHILEVIGDSKVLIITNGTHIPDFTDVLSSYQCMVKISLDGTPSVHNGRRKTVSGKGTYQKTVDGVKKAREAGIPVTVKVNIDSGNLDALHPLVNQFKSYGWLEDDGVTVALARVKPTPEYPSAWTRAEYVEHVCHYLETHNLQDNFEVTFHNYEYFRDVTSGETPKTSTRNCSNHRIFFFSPDGLIYPCVHMMSYPVGTFFPDFSLDEDQIAALAARTFTVMPECMQCKYALLCGGGCSAESLQCYGSIFHPMCIDYPRLLRAYIPYLLQNQMKE